MCCVLSCAYMLSVSFFSVQNKSEKAESTNVTSTTTTTSSSTTTTNTTNNTSIVTSSPTKTNSPATSPQPQQVTVRRYVFCIFFKYFIAICYFSLIREKHPNISRHVLNSL